MSNKEKENKVENETPKEPAGQADAAWFFLKITTWWKLGLFSLIFSAAGVVGTYCGYTSFDKARKELIFQCAKEKADLEKDLIVSKDIQLLEGGNAYLRQWKEYERNKQYIARMANLSNCDTLLWAESMVDSLLDIYNCNH